MKRRHACLAAASLVAGVLLLVAGFWCGRAFRAEGGGAQPPPRKVYVVQKLLWRFRARGEPYVLDDFAPGTPARAFADRGRAAAACQDLNRQKRATENPFRYMPDATAGSYLDQCATMGEAAFLALLRAEGLTPPTPDPNASTDFDEIAKVWAGWWEEQREGWDDRLVERLWDALDRVRFYEVVAVVVER